MGLAGGGSGDPRPGGGREGRRDRAIGRPSAAPAGRRPRQRVVRRAGVACRGRRLDARRGVRGRRLPGLAALRLRARRRPRPLRWVAARGAGGAGGARRGRRRVRDALCARLVRRRRGPGRGRAAGRRRRHHVPRDRAAAVGARSRADRRAGAGLRPRRPERSLERVGRRRPAGGAVRAEPPERADRRGGDRRRAAGAAAATTTPPGGARGGGVRRGAGDRSGAGRTAQPGGDWPADADLVARRPELLHRQPRRRRRHL